MQIWNAHHICLVILVSSAVPLIGALSSTVCADRFTGLSFADPASCSSFYVCQRGNAIRRECSSGLYYDPKIQTCNLPGLIKCFNGDRGVALLPEVKRNGTALPDGKPKEVATTTPPHTTAPHTTAVPLLVVTTKNPKMAATAIPISQDDASDADGAHAVTQDTPHGMDVLRSSRDCRGIADGEYLADPKHCRRFYMCHKNRPKRHNCPRNHWFDRETKSCQVREKVLNCPSNRN
ncbi:protein obstructor-E [Drosophila santomea]|uniref:protein obstructor-E n=1 Tax=Drosophila santomea TaxID=129105 RepID=UPI0019543429|nr:protein obstructor-E [Drosophila santomea]